MAHLEQQNFFRGTSTLPIIQKHFQKDNLKILDAGSLDINGNNRYLFKEKLISEYVACDISEGPGVNCVSKIHELSFNDGYFDIIISSECFEHDMYIDKSLPNIIRMLKNCGLFLFSCATTGRPVHGTKTTTINDSPFTSKIEVWSNYYKNITEINIRNIIDIDSIFSEYSFSINNNPSDLYFWGIKK